MTVVCPACNREFTNRKSMGGHIQRCHLTDEQLFWSKVDKSDQNGCWLYMAARDKYGYWSQDGEELTVTRVDIRKRYVL